MKMKVKTIDGNTYESQSMEFCKEILDGILSKGVEGSISIYMKTENDKLLIFNPRHIVYIEIIDLDAQN